MSKSVALQAILKDFKLEKNNRLRVCSMDHLVQGWIQTVSLGGRFLQYLVVKSHNSFATVREVKYATQNCGDKTIDYHMVLYCEYYFPNCTKLW